ncbi:nucleotide pyrophosphohydrolase [Ochrobactrum sp. Kaboul]|nr:nucleotide pyrophosphohydrolase [Ochrobactrum sp. Kaboul]
MEELIEKLRKFRDDRNWAQFHTPKDLAISVSVEANELLEIFQWKNEDQKPTIQELEGIKNEVADVLLYLLLLCDKFDINLEIEARKKIARNEKRFPIESSFGISKPIDKDKNN